jgi:putative MATE family efflux protein
MSVGILGVLSVGLADAFFLARVGSSELAAVGFVYPVIVTLSAFAIGISAGANTALSQAIGRGRDNRAFARLALHALGFGLLLGLAIALVLWGVSEWLFTLLGAKSEVLDAIQSYVPWWAASFPALLVTMVLEATFRASGDGITPAGIMLLTAVLNIAATPVMAFGLGPVPAMGMEGAGLATFAARCAAVVLAIGLSWGRGYLSAGRNYLENWSSSIGEIISVGLPAAASRGINPAGMAAVTAAVATLGDQAVAGFGAAARVQAIAIVPFFALSAGLAPVIGQAWGASLAPRAQSAVHLALWFATLYGIGLGVALWVFAQPLAMLMTVDETAARYTSRYLRVVGWSFSFYGIILATNAALTARSRATSALFLSLVRIGLIYIPLAWAGVQLFGYDGILAAAVTANVAVALAALFALGRNDLLSPHSQTRRLTLSLPALGEDNGKQ